MRSPTRALSLVVSALLVGGACGGDDTHEPSTTLAEQVTTAESYLDAFGEALALHADEMRIAPLDDVYAKEVEFQGFELGFTRALAAPLERMGGCIDAAGSTPPIERGLALVNEMTRSCERHAPAMAFATGRAALEAEELQHQMTLASRASALRTELEALRALDAQYTCW